MASLIQNSLRRRNELVPYARREIYRELAFYLQTEISTFPDELVEMLSDEQYLINAADVLFGEQRLSRTLRPREVRRTEPILPHSRDLTKAQHED